MFIYIEESDLIVDSEDISYIYEEDKRMICILKNMERIILYHNLKNEEDIKEKMKHFYSQLNMSKWSTPLPNLPYGPIDPTKYPDIIWTSTYNGEIMPIK